MPTFTFNKQSISPTPAVDPAAVAAKEAQEALDLLNSKIDELQRSAPGSVEHQSAVQALQAAIDSVENWVKTGHTLALLPLPTRKLLEDITGRSVAFAKGILADAAAAGQALIEAGAATASEIVEHPRSSLVSFGLGAAAGGLGVWLLCRRR